MIWSLAFWKGAAERALKSFAQALVVFVGAAGVGVLDVDWPTALGVSVAFALASVLTSIGNADFVAGAQLAPLVLTAQTVPAPARPRFGWRAGGPVEVRTDPDGKEYLADASVPPPVVPPVVTSPPATYAERQAAKRARSRGGA